MIKAVVNAIPTFPMLCFKFSIKSCEDLDSLVSNFWWDGATTSNKIYWLAWQKMVKPKTEGGMVFKDFINYNLALLAKAAWRLLQTPDDLWIKVLKGIYFPKNHFLDAKKGTQGLLVLVQHY